MLDPQLSVPDVLKEFKLEEDSVVAVYLYGSRVYGVQSPESDWDYIIVVQDDTTREDFHPDRENGATSDKDNDAILVTESTFNHLIQKEHKNNLVECLWLPPSGILLEQRKPEFILDKLQLRSSFSAMSANAWSKAGKKLVEGPDYAPYIAKKSLFHSFRILLFGIQICKHGKIIDYAEANPLWEEIKANPSLLWADYKALYQKKYTNLKSEFRKVAPKPV